VGGFDDSVRGRFLCLPPDKWTLGPVTKIRKKEKSDPLTLFIALFRCRARGLHFGSNLQPSTSTSRAIAFLEAEEACLASGIGGCDPLLSWCEVRGFAEVGQLKACRFPLFRHRLCRLSAFRLTSALGTVGARGEFGHFAPIANDVKRAGGAFELGTSPRLVIYFGICRSFISAVSNRGVLGNK